jgi:rubredoxin
MAGLTVTHAGQMRPAPPDLQVRECGVCWALYDPAQGDPAAQIPAGTAFDALPAHWCCPNCEAPKHRFMVASND